MQPSWPLVILGSAILTVIAASAGLWLWIGYRWWHDMAIVPLEPRRPVPWNGAQVACLLLAYLALQFAGSMLAASLTDTPAPAIPPPHELTDRARADRLPLALVAAAAEATEKSDAGAKPDDGATPRDLVPQFIANVVVNLLVVVVVIAVLGGAGGATAADLGLTTRRFGYDLRLGLLGFVAATAPVYFIQLVLTQIFESRHPILVMLERNQAPGAFIVAALAAVVVAPVVEELLFRVLLQGWLENWWSAPRAKRTSDLPAEPLPAPPVDYDPATQDALAAQRLTGDENPFASPTPLGAVAGTEHLVSESKPLLLVPILISSSIFALLHAGHGPDPIPLFLLALILGYLYQRTHRIWPSMVLHFALNFVSLAMIAATLLGR
jgi:membrane protease YdiL (CAAX protease family)